VLVAATDAEVRAIARHIARLPPSKRGDIRQDVVDALNTDVPLHTVIDDWLIGTPDTIARQIQVYQSLGISHFMLWFLDFPSLEGLSFFASKVIPALEAFA